MPKCSHTTFCFTELTYWSRCFWGIPFEIDEDVFEFMKQQKCGRKGIQWRVDVKLKNLLILQVSVMLVFLLLWVISSHEITTTIFNKTNMLLHLLLLVQVVRSSKSKNVTVLLLAHAIWTLPFVRCPGVKVRFRVRLGTGGKVKHRRTVFYMVGRDETLSQDSGKVVWDSVMGL